MKIPNSLKNFFLTVEGLVFLVSMSCLLGSWR
jgi:hypothetical protein